MIRLVLLAVVALVALSVVAIAVDAARARVRGRLPRPAPKQHDYGEWIRIELREDTFLRELSKTRGLRIHDATRVGYPERMRNYRRAPGAPGQEPGSGV